MKFNLKSIKIKKVYTGGGVGMCPGDNAPKEEARASKACANKFISIRSITSFKKRRKTTIMKVVP